MAFARRPHVLAPNTRDFRPQYHIFVDVETDLTPFVDDAREHRFKLGWALFWRNRQDGRNDTLEWYQIESKEAFWEWVEDHAHSKSRLLVIAHNVEYDTLVLGAFTILPDRGWELTRFYSANQVAIYSWRRGSKTIQFLDNCNWFKGPLKGWGEVVGLEKLTVDFATVDRQTLSEYCRRDVAILYELWKWWYQFCDDNDLGSWGVTLPSQAFLSYRHRFMPHEIYIHNDPEVLLLERAAYHGGRTECFRVGEYTDGPFYKVDVNSMYPWVMQTYEYPNTLRGHSESVTIANLRYMLTRYCVIADVSLFAQRPYFPAYREDRIVYPVGEFQTVLSTPELEFALRNGWIEKVHSASWYTKAPIFREYVDYFYHLKEREKRKEHVLLSRLAKLMLNSLYGKFGQKATDIKVIGECDPSIFKVVYVRSFDQKERGVEYYVGGKIFWSTRGGESYHSFPAIAAHVTAHARMQLYKMVEAAGRENCYYCDTDSLIINEEAFERFTPWISPYTLGMLKVEKEANYLRINAPKDYVMGTEAVIKGVKKNAVWLDDHTVEQEVFPSIKGLLAQGAGDVYKTHKQVKVLKREIKSGWVGEGGFVNPWGLTDLLGIHLYPRNDMPPEAPRGD